MFRGTCGKLNRATKKEGWCMASIGEWSFVCCYLIERINLQLHQLHSDKCIVQGWKFVGNKVWCIAIREWSFACCYFSERIHNFNLTTLEVNAFNPPGDIFLALKAHVICCVIFLSKICLEISLCGSVWNQTKMGHCMNFKQEQTDL